MHQGFLYTHLVLPGGRGPSCSISRASFLKSERPASDFHSHKCLELDLCGLCSLSFSLVSVTLSPSEEFGFSCLKRKGKCPDFLCASHFSFVYSTPVRLFLFPEMLYSAWYLHQRYFNNSNSQSSESYF